MLVGPWDLLEIEDRRAPLDTRVGAYSSQSWPAWASVLPLRAHDHLTGCLRITVL